MSNFAFDADEGLDPVAWHKRGVAVRALSAWSPVSHRGTGRDTMGNFNQLPIVLFVAFQREIERGSYPGHLRRIFTVAKSRMAALTATLQTAVTQRNRVAARTVYAS